MMGRQGGSQDRLFYSFRLDEYVPKDHLLRGIDKFLDLSDLRTHLASFYSHTGRPSIDLGIPVDRDHSFRPIVTDDSGLS